MAPFEYNEYRADCLRFTDEQLQQEFQRYNSMMGSSSATMGVGIGLAMFTFGLSLIGTAGGAATARNATKKMQIIEEECNKRGISPVFRKRDFFKGYGVGCTVGAVTHGAAGHLASSALTHATTHVVHHAASQSVQHATSAAAAATPTTHDGLAAKAIEHGADKLGQKGAEALEKHAYGVTVLTRELTPAEKDGDSESCVLQVT